MGSQAWSAPESLLDETKTVQCALRTVRIPQLAIAHPLLALTALMCSMIFRLSCVPRDSDGVCEN